MTVERRAPAPRPRSSTTGSPRRPSCPRPAGQRGRPQLAYTVTDKADGLFPKAYGELTNELLGYVVRGRRRASSTRCSSGAATSGSATRPNGSRECRSAEGEGRRAHAHPRRGRLPRDVRGDRPGVYRIVEHNCAIWAVAQRYGQACTSEIDFIRAVLPEARRSSACSTWSPARPHCAYEVRPSR